MRDSFYVQTNYSGHNRKIRVVVYDTQEQMVEAINKYAAKNELSDEDATDKTVAVTHSFSYTKFDDDGKVVNRRPLVNIIRFHKARLGMEVIVHESAHAALHIYSLDCMNDDDLAVHHVDPANEKFCYLMGKIAKLINIQMHDRGHYDTKAA